MAAPDRFAFAASFDDELRQGLPPIVGSSGASAWFAQAGHVSVPEFGLQSEGGFYVGLDLQPDSWLPQTPVGVRWQDSAFIVRCNDPDPGAVTVEVRSGKDNLVVCGEGSLAAARRLLVTGDRASGRVSICELQPWALQPGDPLEVQVVSMGRPTSWPPTEAGFAIGGVLADGTHEPGYVGKAAEVFLGAHELSADRPSALALASDNPTGLSAAAIRSPSTEMRDRFLRDLAKLRRWLNQPKDSNEDLDDASLILYRWLLDDHPLLIELATMLGVQLMMPGMTDRERDYLSVVLDDKPTFQMTGTLGPDSVFGSTWQPAAAWTQEPVFHANGHPVSLQAFIKFVCNKLGARHFDEQERKRWQRELLELAGSLRVMGQGTLMYQLRSIVDAVLYSVSACRIEALVLARPPT